MATHAGNGAFARLEQLGVGLGALGRGINRSCWAWSPLPNSQLPRESLPLPVQVLNGDNWSRTRQGVGKGRVSKYLRTVGSGVHRKPRGCKHSVLDMQYLCGYSHVGSLFLEVEAAGQGCVGQAQLHPLQSALLSPGCSRGKLVLAPLFSPQSWVRFVLEPVQSSWSIPNPMAGAGGINL